MDNGSSNSSSLDLPVGRPRTSSQGHWLEVRDLAKQFGGVYALKEVSLAIRRGAVHGTRLSATLPRPTTLPP